MAARRPAVTVFNPDTLSGSSTIAFPDVLTVPIRQDIVHTVHRNMSKNKRQPYAVSERAGHQHSAESWGTGRAVARIPRVSGGGTHRAGQAAFGNMCRKGRMFNPTKTWRKWHRESNLNERRIAVCSALAASAVPALVMARGHSIDAVSEIPLVLSKNIEGIEKTKDAVKVLKNCNAYSDVEKAANSRRIRTGKGKWRNRRYVMRRGPLVVHAGNPNLEHAFRNISGVELANVERLNLLQLAPGGHLGRFIIFTQGAFERLDSIFGTYSAKSAQKSYFTLPRSIVAQADVARIINSDEVQSVLKRGGQSRHLVSRKVNPLRNVGALLRLNPHAANTRREGILASGGKRKNTHSHLKGASGEGRAIKKVKRTRADKRELRQSLTHMIPGTDSQPGAQFLQSFNKQLAK
jgi:large subunit ribosomal protein L4e